MSEIWYDDSLSASPDSVEQIIKGVKSTNDLSILQSIKGVVRLHLPRSQKMDSKAIKKLSFPTPTYQYITVRLGCELDPGPQARAIGAGFASAVFSTYLWGEDSIYPRVYKLAPVELTKGGLTPVTLKLEPSVDLASVAGGSLGGIETEVMLGQVAPIVRGFAGKNETQPYWNMQAHREAPLYGLRHFWLIVEAPPQLNQFYISCNIEGYLQTKFGRLLLEPLVKHIEHRPRHLITL